MKNLVLVRHAKSSWEHPVIDFERSLKKRGLEDSLLVSKYIKNKILKPDLILSSDAFRAKNTAQIFIDKLDFFDVDFELSHKLYDFSGRDLLEVITTCDYAINNLMVFGHNHAITGFVNMYGSEVFDNVPTCGLVSINFEIDSWKDISVGKTAFKVFPKDLK